MGSMRLVETTLLGNMQEEAVDYTPEVNDVLLAPHQSLSLNDFEFKNKSGDGIRTRHLFHNRRCGERGWKRRIQRLQCLNASFRKKTRKTKQMKHSNVGLSQMQNETKL